MEIDVVLLHRFAAIVELLVFSAFGGNELTRCKGSYGLFVGQNTIQAVAFADVMPGVFLLYELLFSAIFSTRIWEFNWSVRMRMTPLEIFRKPINPRNLITPARKNMKRMYPLMITRSKFTRLNSLRSNWNVLCVCLAK